MTNQLPLGFAFAGVHAGIKRTPGKLDLSLIVCPEGATAAGVYTQNLFFAAPVRWDRERTPSNSIRAVVINSGNANACTGEQGWRDTARMAQCTAAACGIEPDEVLVMSTGIIGHFLPMNVIEPGIQQAHHSLGNDSEHFEAAATGILTTDSGKKIGSRSFTTANGTVQLAAMAKGAGMIGPNMATLLGLVVTDAQLTPADAQRILKQAADVSFNSISVEGHTSTNDTLLLLSSGKAVPQPLAGGELERFAEELTSLCIQLAKMIPDDGEGASHLIQIEVSGSSTNEEAERVARTIADSALVKTAVTGNDPNWGRIMSAAGYAGVEFDVKQSALWINGIQIFADGEPREFDAADVSNSMRRNRETILTVQLGTGDGSARFWTSDLTVDYVTFNADYTT
jgi:glutamate N-acetyltransferase/amino-acid N-acetyltransferase